MFYLGPKGQCIDVDECLTDSPCLAEFECRNTLGSYECLPKCADGLELFEDKCIDIDECSRSSDLCPVGHQCTNFIGGYRCDCPSGFELDSETQDCTDIDECSNLYSVCGLDSVCQNSPGSYRYSAAHKCIRSLVRLYCIVINKYNCIGPI